MDFYYFKVQNIEVPLYLNQRVDEKIHWNFDKVDLEIVEILVIVDKEVLPISNSLYEILLYRGFLWNSGWMSPLY